MILATLARVRVAARMRAMDAYAILSLQNGDVHAFSSTQVDLPPSLADAVRSLQVLIPDDHLTGDGLEMRPHVTVKYGIHDDNAAEAKAIVSGTGPITLTLGSTGVFEADDYDVVYVAVDSQDLELLNAALSAGLAVTDTHPTYTPHATVAYVTKGLGKIYEGNPTLTGMTATVDGLRFISKNGMETLIRTAGGPGSGNFGHGGRPGEVGGSTESDAAHQAAHDRGFYHGQTGYGFQKQTAGRKGSTLYKAYRKGYDAGVDASGDLHHTPSSAHDTTEHQQHIARLDALSPAERQKVEEVWDTSRGNAADTVPSSIKGDDRASLIHVMGVRAVASHAEDAGVDPTLVQAFVAQKFGFKSWQALRADADRWANDPESQRYARFLGGPGSGDFGHGGRPGEVGGSEGSKSTGPSQTVYRRTAKTAAELSGKTPDLPVKTIRAYHVTKRENAESILKNGFDLRKVKPRWINDYAVSLSKGKQDSVDYFSRVDPKTNKPIGMDTSKYALLEVTLKGRIGGHDDVKGFSHTAMQYRQDVIDQGYDGQDLGLQIYLHNPQAISQIREVPAPVRGAKKVRGAGGPGSGNFGHPGYTAGGRAHFSGKSADHTVEGDTDVTIINPHSNADKVTKTETSGKGKHTRVRMYEGKNIHLPTATVEMDRSKRGLPPLRFEAYHHTLRMLGGPGSGNFGHGGRPGEVGGSSDGDATLGPRPTPIKVTKVKDAIPLILQGKVVELPNVRKVNVLMTRLAKIAKDAKKRGEDAPKYDACQIVVPGSNIFCGQHLKTAKYPNGLPRVIMPQFAGAARPGSKADALPKNDKGEVDAGPEFVDYLEKQGINSKSLEVPSDSLLPSQAQLDGPKIAKRIAKKDYEAGGPIFISRDNYIVDGHHRWAAVVGRDAEDGKLGDSSIRAVKIDAPISEILHIANKWTKSYGLERKAVGRAAGGPGSGNFGHEGRPGEIGGSGQGSASPRGSAKPLKTGKITGSEQLSGTINDVRILTLADETGKSFKAVFKPASGESWTNGEVSAKGYREEFGTLPTSESALENAMNEGHDFNDESPVRETVTNREFSYAEREAAAFDVDEALGLGVVPPTTTRTVDDQWGAVQTFVDTSSGLGYLDDNIDQDSVYGVAVLDIATANTDRHGGNLLVDNDRKLVAIDHGLSFPEAATDQTEFRPHATTVALIEHQKPMSDAYAARIRQGLEDTDWNSFAAQRWPNMNNSEREGFLERMNTLKDVFDPDVYSDPSSGVRETLYNMSLASSIASHRQAVMHVEYPGNTDKGIQAGHTNA